MANQYLGGFIKDATKRYNKDSSGMSHGQFMCINTTLNKKPFTFDKYPFQRAIADDMHENLDCMKPSQVGLTEIQIRKALSILTRTDNRSLIYTMPNDKMFKRISKTRIQPILQSDAKAFRLSGDVKNSMGLMQIGTSFMYVTGSTEGDATSINADFIFNDEVDLTDQSMLALFNSRLQGSDLRIRQRFSTPTYNGFGIHKGYAASDQHEFMIKCRACNHWQIPLFTKEFIRIPGLTDRVNSLIDLEPRLLDDGLIDLDALHITCEKCRRRLNMADYESRAWVAKYPNRTHHRGYHVRPFSTHTLDAKYVVTQLFDYKRRNNLKGFHNTVLGETYDQGNSRLTQEQIEAVMIQDSVLEPAKGHPVFIGIDVGATCHIVLAVGPDVDNLTVFRFETCSADNLSLKVKGLREQYNIVSGGIDRYPYTPTSNAIRDQSFGLIMPVEYGKGREFMPIKDEFLEQAAVRAGRTTMLDTVANGIRNGTWKLAGYRDDKSTLTTHLMDMVREEGTGEDEATWVKLNENDHYFHALAFMVAGVRNFDFQSFAGDYQHVDDSIVMDEVELDDTKIWAAMDLIGFEPQTRRGKNIITRY